YGEMASRGYWPEVAVAGGQAEQGITTFFAHDVHRLGIEQVVEQAIEIVGPGRSFRAIDVDALDPAFAPAPGTPEPGGLTSADLLWAVRTVASKLEIVGA